MENSNDNWYKLIALIVVGGVAKRLFGPPPTSTAADRVLRYNEIIQDRKASEEN